MAKIVKTILRIQLASGSFRERQFWIFWYWFNWELQAL